MQIDVTQQLYGYDNEPVPHPTNKKVTLGWVCCEVLVATQLPGEDPSQITGEAKVHRFTLAARIFNATGAIDLTPEDVALLRELIPRAFGPNVVGPAWAALDPVAE